MRRAASATPAVKRRWRVRLRWAQPMMIDTVVNAYSADQATYLGWLLHRNDGYVLDDAGRWDHAEAHELGDSNNA